MKSERKGKDRQMLQNFVVGSNKFSCCDAGVLDGRKLITRLQSDSFGSSYMGSDVSCSGWRRLLAKSECQASAP